MKQSHIVLISSSYPDRIPGSEAAGTFVADFALELEKHARITVVAPGQKASHEQQGNIQIIRFAAPRLPLSNLNPLNPLHWAPILKTMKLGYSAVIDAAAHKDTCHIIALWAIPSGYWARKISKQNHIPYSIWALGSDIWSLGKIPIVRSLLSSILRDAHCCFADGIELASQTASIATRPCGFLPTSRCLVAHPQNRLRKASAKPPFRFAFLGRWHYNKGIDLLLQALLLLNDDDWQHIEMIRIAGGGPMHEVVHSTCEQLISCDRPIQLEGYKGKTEARELLEWTDYIVIPSRIESIPIIFSDAMQCLRPIISTPVGDLPDLIRQHQVGLLTDAVTPEAIANSIRQSLGMSPTNFEINILNTAQRFDLKATTSKFVHSILENQIR